MNDTNNPTFDVETYDRAACSSGIPATGIISTDIHKSPFFNDMSLQERLDFARDNWERLEWGTIIVSGPHRGTELDLTAANYSVMRRRYGLGPRDFKAYIHNQCERLQRNLDEGIAVGLKDAQPASVEG